METGVETGVGDGTTVGEGEAVAVGVGLAVGLGRGVGVGVGLGVGVGVGLDPLVVSVKPVGGVFKFTELTMNPKEALPPGGIELCQE